MSTLTDQSSSIDSNNILNENNNNLDLESPSKTAEACLAAAMEEQNNSNRRKNADYQY